MNNNFYILASWGGGGGVAKGPSIHEKWRHHVILQRIQDFLEAFSYFFFFNIKCGTLWIARKITHYSCEDGIEKSVPCDHRLHHSASLVIPNGDPRDGFFYPTPTLMMYLIFLRASATVHWEIRLCHVIRFWLASFSLHIVTTAYYLISKFNCFALLI